MFLFNPSISSDQIYSNNPRIMKLQLGLSLQEMRSHGVKVLGHIIHTLLRVFNVFSSIRSNYFILIISMARNKNVGMVRAIIPILRFNGFWEFCLFVCLGGCSSWGKDEGRDRGKEVKWLALYLPHSTSLLVSNQTVLWENTMKPLYPP